MHNPTSILSHDALNRRLFLPPSLVPFVGPISFSRDEFPFSYHPFLGSNIGIFFVTLNRVQMVLHSGHTFELYRSSPDGRFFLRPS